MKRGEIWWADLPPPTGRRPVVLISRAEAYRVRALVTVAPVTTRSRDIPSEVRLGPKDGVKRDCVINLDTITTIAKAQLSEPITELSPVKKQALDDAIRFALGLRRSP